MDSPRPRILPHALAHAARKFGAPRSGQQNSSRIRSRQPVIVYAEWTIRHAQSRNTEPRDSLNVEITDATDDCKLFVEGHLAEDRIHPSFDFRAGNLGNLSGPKRRTAEKGEK